MPPSNRPFSYSARAHQYARDVVTGIIPACLEVRQACQRHLDHLVAEKKKKFGWRFDEKAANFACMTMERLPHIKGKWARSVRGSSTLLKLEDWQCFITCCIFGWLDKATGLRKYSEVYLEIPRKNAKTTWAAGVGIIMTFLDGEYGAEVYAGATNERQAMEVFGCALKMLKKSPTLCEFLSAEHAAKSIYREEDGSRFVPVVGDPGDGASPSCGIVDEVHEHKKPNLIETFSTGMMAREQPLLLQITTAGFNVAGPAYSIRGRLKEVLSGLKEDESFFGLIYTIDDGDDWKSDEALRKANPNFGVSVNPAMVVKDRNKAIHSAAKQSAFKTKHLNIWGGAAQGWMNMEAWRKCADQSLRIEDFRGQPCWEGNDLAAKIDLASRAKLFKRLINGKNHYYVFGQHYVPKMTAFDGEHQHYAGWVADGYLTANEGYEIDFSLIEADILRDLPRMNYQRIAFDPYGAQQMAQKIAKRMRDEDQVTDIAPTAAMMTEPMNEIEAAVLSGRFHHTGDPVLEWGVSNTIVRHVRGEGIIPGKESVEKKIDPATALILAMNQACVAPAAGSSVYSQRGIRTL